MRNWRILPALLGSVLLFSSGWAEAADLKVVISGLRSGNGDVHVAIFDTPETFPQSGNSQTDAVVKASPNGASAVFSGLKPGNYALAAFHDENGNRTFDQNVLGIPVEGFGFSNDPPVFLGPPKFTEAAVALGQNDAEIVIHIGY